MNTPDRAGNGVLVQSDGREYRIPPDGLLIGRRADAGLPLDDPEASRHHAQINSRSGRFFVADLGSSNGTLLNGQPIAGESPLADGDVLKIGGTSLTFRLRPLPGTDVGAGPARAPAPPVQPADLSAALGPAVKRPPTADTAAPARLTIRISETPAQPGALLTLAGVLDIETVGLLQEQTEPLLRRGIVQLALEMSEIAYIDSSGLAALVALRREAGAGGGSIRLQHLQPEVRGIVELTRLDRLFDLQ